MPKSYNHKHNLFPSFLSQFDLNRFPRGNGKKISCPVKDGFLGISAFRKRKKKWLEKWQFGKGNHGFRLDSNSKLLQLPGRYLISVRQRDSSEITLSQDFTTASHGVSAQCCPEAWLLKLICQKHARQQRQYYRHLHFIFLYNIRWI